MRPVSPPNIFFPLTPGASSIQLRTRWASTASYVPWYTIDEYQNLFGHEKYGKQAGEDATWIIEIGPAFGVYLILATQRPDVRSPPMGCPPVSDSGSA